MKIYFASISLLIFHLGLCNSPDIKIGLENTSEYEFTEVKVYAIPMTSSTRRPIKREEIKSIYEIAVFTRDIYKKALTISRKLRGLKEDPDASYVNIRIMCELYDQEKLIQSFYINVDGRIFFEGKTYTSNESLTNLVLSLLPEDYR